MKQLFHLIITFCFLLLTCFSLNAQNKVKLDSTIESLSYFVGTWTAMAQGNGGKPIMYSIHTVEPILGGKFLKRSVIQGFNGNELLPYTEETIGWNIAKKEIEVDSKNAPGFIIRGKIKSDNTENTEFTREWTLYDLQGDEVIGKDVWKIKDENLFEWSLFFLQEDKWVEAPFSPFNVIRSLNMNMN